MMGSLPDLANEARRFGLIGDWQNGPDLGAVFVSGPDSGSFLHAQLTSDVSSLEPGQGQLSARLNRKGKLQSWFSLHRLPDRGQPFAVYILLLPRAEISELEKDLSSFVISEDVIIEDISGDFSGFIVQQPVGFEDENAVIERILGKCPAEIAKNWAELPEHQLGITTIADIGEAWVIRRSLTGDPSYLILRSGQMASPEVLEKWSDEGTSRGLISLASIPSAEAQALWRWLQAEAGWPRIGHDLSAGERVLPQTGLDQQVVSSTKGCYLGQEVVARIRTYGSVPEALRAVVWRDVSFDQWSELPNVGEAFMTEGDAKVGTWAGSFWSPVLQMSTSLVFLNRENRTPGNELSVKVGSDVWIGDVAILPLHMGANATEKAIQLHDQALLKFTAGEDEQAVAMLEESLRLDPTRAEAFEALGVILGRLEKFHEAIDIFRRLEEVAPEESMVHTNLSLFYMQIGEKEEAEHQKSLATMKKFGVGVDPKQAAEMAAQERIARQEDAGRKKVMFEEVLEIDPEDSLALMGMGQALATLDDNAGAAEFLQRALKQQDQNSPLYASYGRVLESLGRHKEAA
ncbi:MAG: folate-binding protein YgfZ, partial [Candidatus Krumholzibacteriia bacterium]